MTESTPSRPTILVVDDSRLMRVAARKILKEHFDILEAEDGDVAWDKLQDTPVITLVMSDLSMPNLDGLGLLKKIRESGHAHLRELPVIIVTGAEDDDGSKNTALSAGASDFITKPFESVQLLARARAQVRQQQTQQALQTSEASNQQLEQQNRVDSLTGLGNRRAFVERIEEDLSYAIRHRTDLSLLLLRIDKYKVMFLRRGKQAAEQTLRDIASLLMEDRRREDTVARLGMDSFGILLPSANPPGANRVAQQLLERIDQHDFRFDGESLSVTVSFGVAGGMISATSTAETLLAEAQQSLDNEGSSAVTPAAPPSQTDSPAAQPEAQTAHVETTTEPPQPSSSREQTTPTENTPASQAATPLSPPDVAQALQALAGGTQPAQDINQLARTIFPLLEAWNRTHNGRYSTVIEQLATALRMTGNGTQLAQAEPESAPETA